MNEEELISLLNESKFNDCLKFLNKNKDLKFISTLRKSKVFHEKERILRKSFWQSQLSLYVIKEIIYSPFSKVLLSTFFRNKDLLNSDLILRLWQEDETLFKVLFKRFNCYKNDSWIEGMKNISKSLSFKKLFSLNVLIDQSEYLRKKDIIHQQEENLDYESLIGIPSDKMFLGICYLHSDIIQSQSSNTNISLQMQLDMAIVNEFNFILKYLIKKEHWRKGNSIYKTDSNKIQLSSNDSDLLKISTTIKKGINRQKMKFAKDAYLANFGDFNSFDGIIESIEYNSDFERFQVNNLKNQKEELYFLLRSYLLDFDSKVNEISGKRDFVPQDLFSFIDNKTTEAWIEIFNFYQIPSEISNTNIKIDLVIKILRYFSSYKSEMTSIYSHSELINIITTNFKCEYEVSVEIIDFLTLDLRKVNDFSHYLHRPFLKIDSNFYWLGQLLKNRRWDVILRNKLKEDKLYLGRNSLKALIDKKLEKAIGDLFLKHNFQTNVGFCFPHPTIPNSDGGDIDVIAFKDNYLFVIEVKNNTYSDNINSANYIQNKRLEVEAAQQIDKSLLFIEHNWDYINKHLEISVSKSKVSIIPLIISNIFEGDSKVYGEYFKISLFELSIIMNNDKYLLYRSMCLIPDKLDYSSILETDLDLWEGKKKLDGKTIINCIKNNSVWDKFETEFTSN